MITLIAWYRIYLRSSRTPTDLRRVILPVILLLFTSACGRLGYRALPASEEPNSLDASLARLDAASTVEAGADGHVDSRVGPDAGNTDGGDAGFDSGNVDATTDSGRPDAGTDAGNGLPVTAGLLAWYRFEDDPADGDEVLDSSGNNRNGSCLASDCPTVATGRVGLAYDFDGVDDYVLIDDSDGYFDGTAGFTVAFWTFVRGTAGEQAVVSKPFGTLFANSWQVSAFPPNQIGLNINMGGTDPTPGTFAVGQWIHYAATWDGTTARLYRAGAEIAMSAGTVTFDTRPIVVGGDLNQTTQFAGPLDGLVDELLIYDRELSAAEIGQLAESF